MRTIDAITKRITAKVYTDPNELAREMAAGLAALSRQPSFTRGLAHDTLADVQGGTSLGVGDNSAARISDVLVQNPQPGIPRNVGGGLQTRRQSRIETRVREVPAIVTVAASAGDTTLQVKIVATGVTKAIDPVTGIEIVGDPLANLAASGMNVDDVVGEEITVTVTGSPFVTPGTPGVQPPVQGQTIFITLAEQWETTTSWTKRFRKNLPVVVRVLKERSGTTKNGLANIVSS